MKVTQTVGLKWHCFGKLTQARSIFRNQPCVYMHTDKLRNPIRVGVASKGLKSRYRGGTGYSLDAAMHDSGYLIFVAPMSAALCRAVELELIWGLQALALQPKVQDPTSKEASSSNFQAAVLSVLEFAH
jgi:hypothetical protein